MVSFAISGPGNAKQRPFDGLALPVSSWGKPDGALTQERKDGTFAAQTVCPRGYMGTRPSIYLLDRYIYPHICPDPRVVVSHSTLAGLKADVNS